MKQAVMTAPGHVETREIAMPMPQRGQVFLRIQRIGVCGSDVHVYHGKHPYTSYPFVQGPEFSAVIAALQAYRFIDRQADQSMKVFINVSSSDERVLRILA